MYRILIDGKEVRVCDEKGDAFGWFEKYIADAAYNESDDTIQIFWGDNDELIEDFNFFDRKQRQRDEWMDTVASEHYYNQKYGDS